MDCAMLEVATESGKLVIVPDVGGLTGPLADFTAELEASSLRVLVPARHIFDRVKRAEVVMLAVGAVDETGMRCVGTAVSRTGKMIIADPHMLYGVSFGWRWNRSDELELALKALNRNRRVGSIYATSTGETAVALRVSSGASRYRGRTVVGGSTELRNLIFHEDDVDVDE